MEAQPEHSASEIKRLQRCINDLISLLALPAIWSGGDPSQVLHTLLDALMRMLHLDLISVRLTNPVGESPVEIVKIAQLRGPMPPPHDVCEALEHSLGDKSRKWPPLLRKLMGEGDVSIVPLPLGLEGEFGVIIAAAQRPDFPQQTEALLLSVAANQAVIGLQQSRFRSQQKRVAEELDQRVAQRTAELAVANAELQLQVGLLQHLPVSAWTLKPDGTPDFVNQVWLEFSGQTLDFVRSHPEAWMTAVHPEYREAALRSFWDGVRSGNGFAIETRSRRARDGTYRWHLQQAVALRDAEGKVLKFVGTTTDIDDQKRAQEELRASEGKLQRVIDTIPTLVWCNLPDGPNEFLSKSWHQYTGLSSEEAHGWGWQAAFHPEDLPALMKKWQELLVSRESGEIEARLRRHDGEYRWFLIRVAPFRNHAGAIERWYGTSTDIDDRKKTEEALRDSERSLRLVLNGIAGLVAIMNATGEVEVVNRQVSEYFGKAVDEMKGWSTSDAVHPDDLPDVIIAWKHSLEAASPYDVEHRLLRADGVYRWFHARGLPLLNADGRIVRWYVLLTDIDDRRQAEEALRASEVNLKQIINTIPTPAWSARPDGYCDFVNQRWLDYVGASSEQGIGWGWEVAIHPDDLNTLVEYWRSCLASGNPVDTEARMRRFDGVYRWFLFRANPLRDESGTIIKWYGTHTDIDDRKRAEEALSQARSELAHVSRISSLGVMTASIAHEVNQPLSGIITNASTCLRMLASDPPQIEGARETARRTIRDGNRMSEVITRLRALFSKKDVVTELVDLNEAAREVIAVSSADLQKNRVIVRSELADDLPLVTGDRVQLQQVILNLVRNASDAMSTIEDRPRQLLIRTERDEGDRVRLTVQDTGRGFVPEAADRLFDTFYTTKNDGMGIGLSVSRSIITSHHGGLWAALNDGPGAAFSFSIPRAPEGLARTDGIRNIQTSTMTGPDAA
jgi:PAS domain S-box-containing protein